MQVMLARDEEARSWQGYDLPPSQRQRFVRSLMREHPSPIEGRFVTYRISPTSRYSDIARSTECEVFQFFFGDTPAAMHRSYGRYESHSLFFVVVDRELEDAAGALRVIQHSECGLKTLNDIEEPPLSIPPKAVQSYHGIDSLERCWDVGTMAVRKPYRGEVNAHYVGTMLYGLFTSEATKEGITHATAVLDGHAYRQLTELLAVPFEPIAGSLPFEYLGAKGSRAAYLRVPSIRPNVEAYMETLDRDKLDTLRPCLERVIYAEGVPEPVAVR